MRILSVLGALAVALAGCNSNRPDLVVENYSGTSYIARLVGLTEDRERRVRVEIEPQQRFSLTSLEDGSDFFLLRVEVLDADCELAGAWEIDDTPARGTIVIRGDGLIVRNAESGPAAGPGPITEVCP